MKQKTVLFLITLLIAACSTIKRGRYVMPYLDSRLESKNFVDSLKQNDIDTILVYHKKHGFSREYFLLWLDQNELQLRNIRSTGIFEISDWSGNGFYRNARIFDFYIENKNEIDTDELEEVIYEINGNDTLIWEFSHYPYVDISITFGQDISQYHIPNGINSGLDNKALHFARLIESTIYNLGHGVQWKEAEKKYKYYPKNYNPDKDKWEKWRQEKINNGEIWDDYYH